METRDWRTNQAGNDKVQNQAINNMLQNRAMKGDWETADWELDRYWELVTADWELETARRARNWRLDIG